MVDTDGNTSKPRTSKMHNVQETQKKCFKVIWQLSVDFGRLCIRILVQAMDTL